LFILGHSRGLFIERDGVAAQYLILTLITGVIWINNRSIWIKYTGIAHT
jgi:hypothetical protein